MKIKKVIRILPEEYWWGGQVHDGIIMPYDPGSDRDIRRIENDNQGMPMLISNMGRGVWSDQGFRYRIEGSGLTIEGDGEIREVKSGNSLKEIFSEMSNRFFRPNGVIPEKRLFTHPQYNTWIELMYKQEEEKILEYAKKILDQGYPPGILMIDDNWQEDYGVWDFSGLRFKDPKGMVAKLHSMGFLVMLWVCPYISPDSQVARELMEKGYLLNDSQGHIAIRQWWNGYSGILDLTNPGTREWFRKRLVYLQEFYGIDGFKFDGGDPRIYEDNDQTYSKEVTANEHAKVYNEFGENFPLNEFRVGWKTAGMGLAQRLCDKKHSWLGNGLDCLIPNGLAQGLMGYTFTCPDMIGGGEYRDFLPETFNLDEELFVRYAQCSALFPMMQFSAAPWRLLSDENQSYCREAANLHVEFGDYIYQEAKKGAATGIPIIRHMAFQYPHGNYEKVTSQFMLGDEILVAPVIEKDAREKEIYFPEGAWLGDDDTLITGPCKLAVEAPLGRLPWYRKKGIQ